MVGETDLSRLLQTLQPRVRPGEFVVVALPEVPDARCEAVICEDEAVTCVVTRDLADVRGWPYDFVAGWVTLQVHSSLEAVGLTAAVGAELARAGIAANMLAGFHHDHILVPIARLDDAVQVLTGLSEHSRGRPRPGGDSGT